MILDVEITYGGQLCNIVIKKGDSVNDEIRKFGEI